MESFHTLSAFAHPFLCRRFFQRLHRPPYRINFARCEILAVRIFGELTAHNLLEIDHSDRDFGPCKLLASGKPARARYQPVVGRNDNRMQQADVGDVGGKPGDIANIAAVALPDADRLDTYGTSRQRASGSVVFLRQRGQCHRFPLRIM